MSFLKRVSSWTFSAFIACQSRMNSRQWRLVTSLHEVKNFLNDSSQCLVWGKSWIKRLRSRGGWEFCNAYMIFFSHKCIMNCKIRYLFASTIAKISHLCGSHQELLLLLLLHIKNLGDAIITLTQVLPFSQKNRLKHRNIKWKSSNYEHLDMFCFKHGLNFPPFCAAKSFQICQNTKMSAKI